MEPAYLCDLLICDLVRSGLSVYVLRRVYSTSALSRYQLIRGCIQILLQVPPPKRNTAQAQL